MISYRSFAGSNSRALHAFGAANAKPADVETAQPVDWAGSGTPPPPPPPAFVYTLMEPGQVLKPGEVMQSPDGGTTLAYQADGNLVLYAGTHAVWDTRTFDKTAGQTAMQTDGNLVVYDAAGAAVFNTATFGHPGAFLAVQSNQMAVVYRPGVTPNKDMQGELWCGCAP